MYARHLRRRFSTVSEQRVVGAARQGRCPVQPPDVFGGRCCVRRAGRQRVARIHPDTADASSASLSTRSTPCCVAWACESSSRAPPRSALRCRAAACQRYWRCRCSSSTRRVHHPAHSFECSAVWHSTLKPQRCSLSSSPLASLLSRHNNNSNWLST